MNPENRLQQLTVVPTVARQTPKQDFGTELSAVLHRAVSAGASLLSGSFVSAPVASAAVAAGQVASAALPVSSREALSTPQVPSRASATAAAPEAVSNLVNGSSLDLLSRQQQMQTESQSFTAMYLDLQNQMQQESRQYNAISNIIKSRHDSAKSAINNIR